MCRETCLSTHWLQQPYKESLASLKPFIQVSSITPGMNLQEKCLVVGVILMNPVLYHPQLDVQTWHPEATCACVRAWNSIQ